MPYIEQARRPNVAAYVGMLFHEGDCSSTDYPQNCGELNFALTLAALKYDPDKRNFTPIVRAILTDYLDNEKLRYQRLNDAAGACFNAWLEIGRRAQAKRANARIFIAVWEDVYRELAVPYEQSKIIENGDIPEFGVKS